MTSLALNHGEFLNGPPNIALEPSRALSCAIMCLRRAAQRERWADNLRREE